MFRVLALLLEVKMVLNYNTLGICIECNEGIFNPICPSCLAGQMHAWVESNGFDKKIKENITTFTDRIKNKFIDEGMNCAVCRINQTLICPYCFTEKIYNFLQRLKVSRKILEEFLIYFNYDFEHSGYSEEFENE